MENFGIFMTIWYTLWSFGISCGLLVYFPQFWNVSPRKIWQPCFTGCPISRKRDRLGMADRNFRTLLIIACLLSKAVGNFGSVFAERSST
jgi:hypothetical protein